MKKQLLLFAMILLPMVANADPVEINGIYYNLIPKGKVAEVTSNPKKYTGDVSIPESVTYENTIYSVTSIRERAFDKCSGLTSITIPNSVTSIGYRAFSDCSNLTSANIGNNVTNIGQSVFSNCYGLTTIVIPNSVTSIGDDAFSNCSGLTTVVIPNSVTSIGDYAFCLCSGLITFTIPNSVTSIGDYAFWGCKSLTSINIPNSVTSIGESTFRDCSSLTSVTIPNSVTRIKINAFQGCSGLTTFTIPNSVTSIGEGTFIGCISLTSVTIPNSVTGIGEGAFSGCKGLTSINIPNSVKYIGGYAFSDCSGLTSFTIPNSVTSIKRGTFSGCKGLTFINIPNSVTSIGEGTFSGCSSLTSVTIPNSVISIEESTFYGCKGLTSVNIPKSVMSIDETAFSSCSSLTSVTIGSGIKNIYSNAFAKCPELADVYCFAINVPYTNTVAFKDSYIEYATLHVPAESVDAYKAVEPWKYFGTILSLESTTTYYKLTYLIDNEVYKEYSLENGAEITPEPAPTKEGYTFSGWSEIPATMPAQDVTITGSFEKNNDDNTPTDGVVEIDGIYYNLIGKAGQAEVTKNPNYYTGSVVIPESVVYKGKNYSVTSISHSAFRGCNGLISVSIPSSVTSIGEYAFSESGLFSVIIPNSVTSIGIHAFDCSRLILVQIGSGVKNINSQAFTGCKKITDVYCLAENVPNTKTDAFSDSNIEYSTLHVPASSVDAYKAAEPWKNFGTIVPLKGTTTYYKLTYLIDNEVYKEYSLENGAEITPEPTPTKEGYTFSGWSEIPETMPDHDVTVTGTFTINKYKLTYMVDGEVYKTYDVEYGATITPEAEPMKEGYAFSGWSEIPDNMPANDVTVTGTFTINKYKLTYTVDGNVYKTYDIEYGAKITPESAPSKEGYSFSGWSAIPTTMPAKDVTVTGTFTINKYKLIYKVDGVEYKTYEIEYGASITPEAEPKKEGYTFSGWSWIPNKMPSEDVTVTGTFTINKYKLTYFVDGAEYKSYEIEYGASITPEAEPTKEGYTFSGWSSIPETMPANDVTVSGTFSKGSFKLTYMVDGVAYKTISYDYGDAITPEPDPTKEGYTFSGWSEIPSTMPAKDVTVTGTFNVNKYNLTYMVDGEVYKTFEVEYGASITPEADPTKEGYTFSGWSWIPTKMPSEDVIVTGTFTVNKYKLTYIVDGEVYKTFEVEYGATITPEPAPNKEGYDFSGWDNVPETMPAHDVTVYGSLTVGITDILISSGEVKIFDIKGNQIGKLQKGINILVYKDGKTKKIVMK